MSREKGKKHKDLGFLVDNIVTYLHFLQMNNVEFSKFLDLDPKRWSEVERKRFYPLPSDIDKIITKLGISEKQLMDCQLVLMTKWKHHYENINDQPQYQMQKQIEINEQKYLAVVVPKDALNFRIVGDGNLMFLPNRYSSIYNVDIWIENWKGSEIIGTLDSLTEKERKEMVDTHYNTNRLEMIIALDYKIQWNESSETVLLIKIL